MRPPTTPRPFLVGSEYPTQTKFRFEKKLLTLMSGLYQVPIMAQLRQELGGSSPPNLDGFLQVYAGFPYLLSLETVPKKLAPGFWKNLFLNPQKSGIPEIWDAAQERLGALTDSRRLAIIPNLSTGNIAAPENALVIHAGTPRSPRVGQHGVLYIPVESLGEDFEEWSDDWLTIEPLLAFLQGIPAESLAL